MAGSVQRSCSRGPPRCTPAKSTLPSRRRSGLLSMMLQYSSGHCWASGALNSVANGRILRETPFEELYIQPAAGDAGGALGVHRHRSLRTATA